MKKVWMITLVMLLVSPMLVTAAGPKKVQIEGTIDAVDAANQQITVGDVIVQATPDTAITMKDQVISFDDLKVGMTVRVCGKMDGDLLIAEKINVKYLGK